MIRHLHFEWEPVNLEPTELSKMGENFFDWAQAQILQGVALPPGAALWTYKSHELEKPGANPTLNYGMYLYRKDATQRHFLTTLDLIRYFEIKRIALPREWFFVMLVMEGSEAPANLLNWFGEQLFSVRSGITWHHPLKLTDCLHYALKNGWPPDKLALLVPRHKSAATTVKKSYPQLARQTEAWEQGVRSSVAYKQIMKTLEEDRLKWGQILEFIQGVK